MVTIEQLLTAAKSGAGIPSNYRLARVMGVSDNTLNRWQHARSLPDDITAAKLAEMAGMDPDFVVASMHAARAAEGTERSLWQRIAGRLEKAGALGAAAILSLFITGGPDAGASLGQAAETTPVHNESSLYTL